MKKIVKNQSTSPVTITPAESTTYTMVAMERQVAL